MCFCATIFLWNIISHRPLYLLYNSVFFSFFVKQFSFAFFYANVEEEMKLPKHSLEGLIIDFIGSNVVPFNLFPVYSSFVKSQDNGNLTKLERNSKPRQYA